MRSRLKPIVFGMLGFCAALTACGTSSPDHTPSNASGTPTEVVTRASVNLLGTMDGKTYAWADAVASVKTVNGVAGAALVTLVSDTPDLCDALGSGAAIDGTVLEIVLTNQAGGAITAVGYPIDSAASSTNDRNDVAVTLHTSAPTVSATIGEVALTYVSTDNSRPDVMVITATGPQGTLSGSITATPCAAAAAGLPNR